MMLIIYRVAKSFVWLYLHAIFRFQVYGRQNVPKRGGVLLAANHISAYDPPAIGCVIPRPAYFMAKKELFDNPVKKLGMTIARCIPIHRGEVGRATIKRISELLKQGQAILLFPEGTRSNDGELLAGKEGMGMLAVHNNVDVVPVHVGGLFKVRGSIFRRPKISISFGEPVRISSLIAEAGQNRREFYRAITTAVFERIRELGSGSPAPR